MRAGAEPIGMVRRLSLAVTNGLHRLVLGGSAIALGGLPRAGGLPVLRGPGTGPEAREQLEAALELLARLAPGLRERLQHHVLSIFLTHRPRGHGHYSRITGTCILDLDQLIQQLVTEVACSFGCVEINLYLHEPEERAMVLAGTHGCTLHGRGSRLRVGKDGMVGYVAATGQMRYAPDVAGPAPAPIR